MTGIRLETFTVRKNGETIALVYSPIDADQIAKTHGGTVERGEVVRWISKKQLRKMVIETAEQQETEYSAEEIRRLTAAAPVEMWIDYLVNANVIEGAV